MEEQALGGGLVVRTVDLTPRLDRAVRASLESAASEAGVLGSVTIRMERPGTAVAIPPAQELAGELSGDAGDGRVVARTPTGIAVETRHGGAVISGTPEALEIAVGSGATAWAVLRDLVRPGIQVAGIAGGTVVIHAAAVELAGRAVLVSGWSESGKTEVALALAEAGARFIGDKWTITAPARATSVPGTRAAPPDAGPVSQPDGSPESLVWPFPVRVGIRDWVLPYLPRLAGGISGRRRARVRAGGTVGSAVRRVAASMAGSPALDALLGPVGDVAGLAGTIRLPVEEIRRIHEQSDDGAPVPLGALVVLTTLPAGSPVMVRELSAEEGTRRLARSAAYERRLYHLLGERSAFHGASPVPGFEIVDRETEALRAAIGAVPVLDVRAPFPNDPNLAARAIADALEAGVARGRG